MGFIFTVDLSKAARDGSKPADAAIQDAINSVVAWGGGTIVLPRGIYRLDAPLDLSYSYESRRTGKLITGTPPNGLTLLGCGASASDRSGTFLSAGPQFRGPALIYSKLASFLSIRGVGLHYAPSIGSGQAVMALTGDREYSQVLIDECSFSGGDGSAGDTVVVLNRCRGVRFRNCRFDGAAWGARTASDGSHDVTFEACAFTRQTDACVARMENGWTFSACRFEPTIDLLRPDAGQCFNSDQLMADTLSVMGCSLATMSTVSANALLFSGCHFQAQAKGFVSAGGLQVTAGSGITLAGNRFESGAELMFDPQIHGVAILGNYFEMAPRQITASAVVLGNRGIPNLPDGSL